MDSDDRAIYLLRLSHFFDINFRLLEIGTSTQKNAVLTLLKAIPSIDVWKQSGDGPSYLRVSVPHSQVEQVVRRLQTDLAAMGNPKVLILSVETVWPVPDLDSSYNQTSARLSREAIYTKVAQQVQRTWTQVSMVVLSTLIAAIDLSKGSEAILIGAMFLAPLLRPILG